jgi:chitinase
VEVGAINTACNFNHQSACCTSNAATLAYGKCKWVGGYPTCSKKGGHADCPSDHPNFVVAASTGFGGEEACETGAKSYCCADDGPPAAFTNCEWYKQASGATSSTDKHCLVACPKDTVRISWQKLGGCPGGSYDSGAYCCKGQPTKTLQPRDPSTGNVSNPSTECSITQAYKPRGIADSVQ